MLKAYFLNKILYTQVGSPEADPAQHDSKDQGIALSFGFCFYMLNIDTPVAASINCHVMNQSPDRIGPIFNIRTGAAYVAPSSTTTETTLKMATQRALNLSARRYVTI